MAQDIYCPRCGEAFALDEFHEYVNEPVPGGLTRFESFKQVKDFFYARGCGVLLNGKPCKAGDEGSKTRAAYSSALSELLGDDVDGIASELEDAEYLGLL